MVFDDEGTRLIGAIPTEGSWFAAVRVTPEPHFDGEAAAHVELADGSRVPGRMIEAGGDELVWESPRFGVFRTPASEVAAFAWWAAAPDEVGAVLRNGDRVEGEVRLTAAGVRVLGGAGDLVVPMERVASVRLRGSVPAGSGTRVWFRDGGVVRAEEAVSVQDGRGVRVGLRDGRVGVFLRREVVAVTRRGAAVGRIGAPVSAGAGVEVAGGTHLVRGPAVAVWKLPAGCVGLAGSARTPEGSVAWGEASVSAWAGSALAWSARTTPERPSAALAAEIRGADGERDLTVSVQPGRRGRANAVVELRLLVVEGPGAER